MNRYYLSITTWNGLAPGATHYYGRLYGEFKDVISKPKDGKNSLGFGREEYDVEKSKPNKEGWKTRFNSEKSVITAAIKTFLRLKLKGLLYIGSAGTCQPQRILIAPKSLEKKAKEETRLWQKMETVYRRGGWEQCEKEMEAICKQWEKLWEETEFNK